MSELTRATAGAVAKPTVRDLVQRQESAIKTQLAGALNSEAFVRAAVSEISASPQLQQADPKSVLGAVMLAAKLKLEIGSGLGHFFLTPRKVRGEWQCVPIIGYQGLIELAYRSGRIEKIESFLVRDGDLFEVGGSSERGTFFDWKPQDNDETRPWTHAVAVAKIVGGSSVWRFLTKQQVLARRPAHWDKGPWSSHEEEMAQKTVIRYLATRVPKSSELATAVEKSRQVEERGDLVVKRDGIEELAVVETESE